jgi:hypothetical protein
MERVMAEMRAIDPKLLKAMTYEELRARFRVSRDVFVPARDAVLDENPPCSRTFRLPTMPPRACQLATAAHQCELGHLHRTSRAARTVRRKCRKVTNRWPGLCTRPWLKRER